MSAREINAGIPGIARGPTDSRTRLSALLAFEQHALGSSINSAGGVMRDLPSPLGGERD